MTYPKIYLGDGVYVKFDGFNLNLTAENGIVATDCIVLEPSVYSALIRYVEKLEEKKDDQLSLDVSEKVNAMTAKQIEKSLTQAGYDVYILKSYGVNLKSRLETYLKGQLS